MKRVSLRDIATHVGYSRNTVSLALRGDARVPASTAALVKTAAEALGYQSNPLFSEVMSQMKTKSGDIFRGKLALINAHRDKDAFEKHATIPTYLEGCERRALQSGYSFDRFWLHAPKQRSSPLIRIFRTRGIKGIVVVGLMDQNQLPIEMRPVWESFPTIVTGVRTHEPALSYSCVDHYDLVLRAFERAIELGYRRPALILKERIDRLVDGRFSGAMMACQRAIPAGDRVPAFTDIERARTRRELFHEWFDKHRPDVLLSLYNIVFPWLKDRCLRVPEDVGVVQLEWRPGNASIAGMNQHNDLVGEAAVDMVIGQILRGETGTPKFPRATLVGASWVNGESVRMVSAADER